MVSFLPSLPVLCPFLTSPSFLFELRIRYCPQSEVLPAEHCGKLCATWCILEAFGTVIYLIFSTRVKKKTFLIIHSVDDITG